MSIIVKILYPNKRDMVSFALDDLDVHIGRSSKCDITLEGSLLSSKHMRIFSQDGKTYIQDLGSKNGTMLNNTKIRVKTRIYLMDEVKMGEYIIALDRIEMTTQELLAHKRPRNDRLNKDLDLPELTRTSFIIERSKEEDERAAAEQDPAHVDVKTSMYKDLEDLSQKTIVKRYKIKSQA